MGLENTFGKAEKVEKEKVLEVITSVDSVVDDLRSYFEQNKYQGLYDLDERRKYFSSCIDFLKSLKITPEIILGFIQKFKTETSQDLGIYLSALIQTSYNKGYNNFVFEEVNTSSFGALLKGQPKNQISIIVKKELKGDSNLWCAKNCSLTINTLEGDLSLCDANSCFAEITNYQGTDFGYFMGNCTIKSKSLETLRVMKEQSDKKGNRFELIK